MAKILHGECVGGGGGAETDAGWLSLSHLDGGGGGSRRGLATVSFAFLSILLPLLKPLLIQGGACLGQLARWQPRRPPRKQRAAGDAGEL